jgi:hypothetical protein
VPHELPDGRVTVPPDVVRRGFGSEAVVLNLKTGHYHALNGTAAHMLDLLEETGDAAETVRRLMLEVHVPEEVVSADLAELCQALTERGLIIVEDR